MKKSLFALAAAATVSMGAASTPATAQQFWIGQVVLGGWSFCPRSTLPADGRLMSIAQYSALFALYGTMYGGDGRTTFGLPDLRGRSVISVGQGPGLTPFREGEKGGAETVTLNGSTLASHTHAVTSTATATLNGSNAAVNSATVAGAALANQPAAHYAGRGALDQVMEAGSVAVTVASTAQNTGGNLPFNIRDPYQVLQYCVVLDGIFPSRN